MFSHVQMNLFKFRPYTASCDKHSCIVSRPLSTIFAFLFLAFSQNSTFLGINTLFSYYSFIFFSFLVIYGLFMIQENLALNVAS